MPDILSAPNILEELIRKAEAAGASDIHLQMTGKVAHISFRLDGFGINASGVEFTNVRIYEQETKRMPNFPLHELAHAYHDQVLDFENKDIVAAYNHAKVTGSYDKVERRNGDGRPNTFEKAYAMTNHMEYFAESTEAFFSRNDFYPFTRADLHKHDPMMEKLLQRIWFTGK